MSYMLFLSSKKSSLRTIGEKRRASNERQTNLMFRVDFYHRLAETTNFRFRLFTYFFFGTTHMLGERFRFKWHSLSIISPAVEDSTLSIVFIFFIFDLDMVFYSIFRLAPHFLSFFLTNVFFFSSTDPFGSCISFFRLSCLFLR